LQRLPVPLRVPPAVQVLLRLFIVSFLLPTLTAIT
jgi:hypothetical protein